MFDMRVDMCTEIRTDMCLEMCANVCADACTGICTGVCTDVRVDMCVDMCVDVGVGMRIDLLRVKAVVQRVVGEDVRLVRVRRGDELVVLVALSDPKSAWHVFGHARRHVCGRAHRHVYRHVVGCSNSETQVQACA